MAEKFVFDTEFSTAGRVASKRPQRPRNVPFEEAEMMSEAARREGEAQAQSRFDRTLEMLLTDIVRRLDAIAEDIARIEIEARSEAATLAYAIARTLGRAAIAACPEADVRDLIETALNLPGGKRELKIALAPAAREALAATAGSIARGEGLLAQIVTDGSLGLHDIRVEWAGGGLERRQDELEAAIEAVIKDYFEAHAAAQSAGGMTS